MPVTLLCPNLRCRAILQVPDACRGKKVRCGQCGIALAVPAGTAPAGAGEPAKGGKGESEKVESKPAETSTKPTPRQG
jgi:hypothetical protein